MPSNFLRPIKATPKLPLLRADAAICVALFFGTILLFARVGANEFIYLDDPEYVTSNPSIKLGLTPQGLWWALTTFHASNWHPLTWVSHLIDYHCFGLNATGHHLISAAIHAINAPLLFLFLRMATGERWLSALAAVLFAWHPLRVESVAWVAERKDVLSGFFFFLSLIAYVRYTCRPTLRRYLLLTGAFILGLASKQMLVTLPFVLLLLDHWPLKRLDQAGYSAQTSKDRIVNLMLEKIPLLLLSAGASALTYIAQRRAEERTTVARLNARLCNVPIAIVSYLSKTICPIHLAAFYPMPWRWPAWEVAASIGLLALITGLALQNWNRRPYLAIGWFWFTGMLVPVIGVVRVGSQAMADRYTYLPGVGLVLAAVWGLAELGHNRSAHARSVAASVAIVFVLSMMTWRQLGFWRDDQTLFRHALAISDDNCFAHVRVAGGLLNEGSGDRAFYHYGKL